MAGIRVKNVSLLVNQKLLAKLNHIKLNQNDSVISDDYYQFERQSNININYSIDRDDMRFIIY